MTRSSMVRNESKRETAAAPYSSSGKTGCERGMVSPPSLTPFHAASALAASFVASIGEAHAAVAANAELQLFELACFAVPVAEEPYFATGRATSECADQGCPRWNARIRPTRHRVPGPACPRSGASAPLLSARCSPSRVAVPWGHRWIHQIPQLARTCCYLSIQGHTRDG